MQLIGICKYYFTTKKLNQRFKENNSYLLLILKKKTNKTNIMALKPGPKRIATSTGKPDQRQRDNKNTPGNTPALKPSKSTDNGKS